MFLSLALGLRTWVELVAVQLSELEEEAHLSDDFKENAKLRSSSTCLRDGSFGTPVCVYGSSLALDRLDVFGWGCVSEGMGGYLAVQIVPPIIQRRHIR